MQADERRLDLTLGKHPMALIWHRETFRLGQSADLKQARHGQRVRVADLVTHRQRPQTASGVSFMTREDGNTHVILRQGYGSNAVALLGGNC